MNGGELAVVAYSYDAVGQLSGKTYGTGTHAIHETMEYNIQGWFTEKNSELFDMSLDYYNKWGRIDDVSPSYTGNITSWQWQHKGDPTGNGPQNRYNFTYDDLSQLTNTDQYVNNEKTRQNVERCLSYDRNGNLQTFIRYENGACVSNSSYNYSGNRLVSYCPGTVFEREDVGIGEIIVPKKGIVFPLTVQLHQYDANGNVTKDWERGLDMSYNCLNLLEYTSDNDANVINYCYLVDGTKLTAVNADDCGFAYRGSFTYYRADAGGDRVFESTRFGGGRIVGTVDDETEVRYFVTDHLGSVRVVATDQNNVLERNDYYPFGKRWDSASLPISDNRDRFNGKEDQAFAGLPFSDYGARMYDRERGRWLSQDPKSEDYFSSTQYGFCGNNPIRLVDLDGMEARDSTSVMIPPVIVYPSEDGGSNSNFDYWGAAYDLLIPGYAMWMEADTYRINGEYGHAAARYLLSTFEAGLFFFTAGQSNNLRIGMQGSRIAANSTKLLGRPIIIPAKNLRWNFEKHVIQIPKYRNKSRFFVTTEKELEQLVEAATHISGYIQKTSGNYIRTVNAGKIISFDVTTNSTTTIYTVVTNSKTNELISIFPGLPK